MWRAIFSLAHTDGVVTDEEKRFMEEKLESLTLSLEQREVLKNDMVLSADPRDLFLKITVLDDRIEFFKIARNLVMADGEYHASEQGIMQQIQELQVSQTDIDTMVGHVNLQFEPDEKPQEEERRKEDNNLINILRYAV